jgi:hypothetical protein
VHSDGTSFLDENLLNAGLYITCFEVLYPHIDSYEHTFSSSQSHLTGLRDGQEMELPLGGESCEQEETIGPGRPVRARTADLHRVNCVVRKLNPFACLAFPFLTIAKIPLNDQVLVTNW